MKRIGVPALAGAFGLGAGVYAGQHAGALVLSAGLLVLGVLAGCVSAVGPVASSAGTQVLVAAAVGAGMPLGEPGWLGAVAFGGGAGWLLLLRVVVPGPGALAGDFRFDGERAAVARVYDAIAELLDAAGTDAAVPRRAALTAALDQAQDALGGPRLRRGATSTAERRLHAQYAAALPLAEAATALAWSGEGGGASAWSREDVSGRSGEATAEAVRSGESVGGWSGEADGRWSAEAGAAEAWPSKGVPGSACVAGGVRSGQGVSGPYREVSAGGGALGGRSREGAVGVAGAGRAGAALRRLARVVREGGHSGPLPAPRRAGPALRALDDALLKAAEAFDQGDGGDLHTRRRGARELLRTAFGAGGREYGFRAGLAFGGSAAVAQWLHHAQWYGSHTHWYWLPATAVFLVKPDLGPLVSRVLCRAAGTVLGALVFAGLAAVLPRPAGLVAVVAVCGALIPVATRHFAAQTAVVTVLVLALVMVGGEPQASVGRIGETLLACVIVLVVGHLPVPGQRGGGVHARLAAAAGAARRYLAQVMSGSDDRARRWVLRREAYRTLAEARAAIALAAAELPALARHAHGADEAAALLERLVDTTTACAVHLDDTGRLTPRHTRLVGDLLDRLAAHAERTGLRLPDLAVDVPGRPPCRAVAV
ncbi:FUSC family protein [Streptomyces sp. NPDC096205]|uniref:FUSC family protein n=1 Tax=Streptomyces sp. NPDC096205 TaxID=3366081 RepID=UPI0037FD4BC3